MSFNHRSFHDDDNSSCGSINENIYKNMYNPYCLEITVSVESLGEKTKEELIALIQFLVLENISLHHKNVRSTEDLKSKDQEISVLRDEILDIGWLKEKVVELKAENAFLRGEVDNLTKKVDRIMEPLSAREIGKQADLKALKCAFPGAMKNPFSLRSFKNLIQFLENPNQAKKEGVCHPDAVLAWSNKSEVDRDQIVRRKNLIILQNPTLLYSITQLKSNWEPVHPVTSSASPKKYFEDEGDEGMAQCVQTCHSYVEAADEETEMA